jgi:hypothetical protein
MNQTLLPYSFDSWYNYFRGQVKKDKHTIKSQILFLPPSVLEYLTNSDSVRLPNLSRIRQQHHNSNNNNNYNDDDSTEWDEDEQPVEITEHHQHHHQQQFVVVDETFEQFDQQLCNVLSSEEFNETGAFIKLNFTAPIDSAWIIGSTYRHSPQILNANDVYLLLKSSDFCNHDYQAWTLDERIRPCLVLKKWCHFRPELEFRCFVMGGSLVVACQRYTSIFSSFLNEPEINLQLWNLLYNFIRDVFIQKFPHDLGKETMGNFMIDVYVEESLKKVWIVDIGPIPKVKRLNTNTSCVFLWDEMNPKSPHPLVSSWKQIYLSKSYQKQIVVVKTPMEEDSSHEKALAMHRVPLELVSGEQLQDVMNSMREFSTSDSVGRQQGNQQNQQKNENVNNDT